MERKGHLRLKMLYFGATTLVFAGIHTLSIQRPSSDVIRLPPESAGGQRRIDSLITASRCGSVARALASVTSHVTNSSYILAACSGYLANKYQVQIRLGRVVSLCMNFGQSRYEKSAWGMDRPSSNNGGHGVAAESVAAVFVLPRYVRIFEFFNEPRGNVDIVGWFLQT